MSHLVFETYINNLDMFLTDKKTEIWDRTMATKLRLVIYFCRSTSGTKWDGEDSSRSKVGNNEVLAPRLHLEKSSYFYLAYRVRCDLIKETTMGST